MLRLTSRTLMVLTAAWALSAGFVAAQQKEGDLVEEVRRREQVAAQALEKEVQDALAEAGRLLKAAKPDPGKAADLLKAVQKKLEDDTSLPVVRRASLRSTVKERLKDAETAAVRGIVESVQKTAPKEPDRAAAKQRDADIRRGLEAIRSLRQQNKLREAQKAADELATRFPDDSLVQMVKKNTGHIHKLDDLNRLLEEKQKNSAAALTDVQRSATPIQGDIKLPADFAEKTAKRKEKYGMVQMTAKEHEIVKALNSVTASAVQLKNQPLDKVIEYLQQELGQPMLINKAGLDDLGLTYESTVTVSLPKGVSKRTLMRSVLGSVGMAYIVKNEAIEVTSATRAASEMTVRYYKIDDFLGLGLAPGQMQLPQIVDLIQKTIEPDSWRENGGKGTIIFHAPTRTLIIKNTAEVHSMLGSGW